MCPLYNLFCVNLKLNVIKCNKSNYVAQNMYNQYLNNKRELHVNRYRWEHGKSR
jgi:hypothetical protein